MRSASCTVSYASAQLNGFASGQPANGDRVEAFGSVDANGVLVATRVERESGGAAGNADEQADYEGLVTSFVSATDFAVAGQRVTTTASTTYEGGTASSLALDVPVEVEGRFNASGVIVATKVQFRRGSDTEFSGRVDSVNAAGNSLVVFGVTVRVNSLTRFEDHSGADVQRFSLANIAVGDYVEVDAYNDGSGLVATKLERDDDQGEVRARGRRPERGRTEFHGRRRRRHDRWQYRIQRYKRRDHQRRGVLPGGPGAQGEGARHAGGQRRAGHAGRTRGLTGVPG